MCPMTSQMKFRDLNLIERKEKIGLKFEYDEECLNLMIENYVMPLCLPLGVVTEIIINEQTRTVPLAIEEPSVIAAISNAARLLSFQTESNDRNIIVGLIYLITCPSLITNDLSYWCSRVNQEICPNMVARGGGLLNIIHRVCNEHHVLEFHLDVCDAMGANHCNDLLEKFNTLYLNSKAEICILSNKSPDRWAEASFNIPCIDLAYKGVDGIALGQKIIMANNWAKLDPMRASSHNKGIMNAIEGIAVACGQDWRAISAANDINDVRTVYRITNGVFSGSLRLNIPVGVVGGVTKLRQYSKCLNDILKVDSSKDLAQVMVACGLAANFSALRAMLSEGIVSGHKLLCERMI